MAAGVPVVASTAGALPEVLGDAALLARPDELAGALVTGVTDQAVRDRLMADGRQQVGRYSWDRCAAGLADIYRDAAG
jgi:glycosyltransferase involved in cell wall biosynthesis